MEPLEAARGEIAFVVNDCSEMQKLGNILSDFNLNIATGKVRQQAAEYRSWPGYNVDSLNTVSRSYWELLCWMTNLFFQFHAFLDLSELLLTVVAPVAILSLLEDISTTFSAHHKESYTQSSLSAFEGAERAVGVDG